MSILTVGTGERFTTIAAAVTASHAGDTILIDAGTYTAKDVQIDHDLTIKAVGGEVDVVAPDTGTTVNVSKGLFVVGTQSSAPNVAIDGLTFSGAKSGQSNGAGIRYQSGNMTLVNDTFHDNQDGILGAPFVDGTGVISIDHSTFDHNGAGDGQSHNMYIGYIDSFTMTNSVSENAKVGHEVKSRAFNNTIVNNYISDGPTGTASYSIDLPNGGNDIIQGNTIEKGPDASSGVVIHVGGPMLMNPQNNVTISGNTIINDGGSSGKVILNQMQTPVVASGNVLEGFASANVLLGYGSVTGSSNGTASSMADITSNYFGNPKSTLDYRGDSADHVLTLTKASQTVQGGAGHLTVTTSKGQETVIGGSGGLTFTSTVGAAVVTAAGSTNQITLGGGGSIKSAGHDTIVMPGKGEVFVSVTGTADITGSSGQTENPYFIGNGGVASIHEKGGADNIFVREGGTLNLDGNNKMLQLTENNANASFDFVNGGVERSGSLVGGNVEMSGKGAVSVYSENDTHASLHFATGDFVVTDVGGAAIDAGGASVTVHTSGSAALSFIGGSGSSKVWTGTGAVKLVAGSGNLTVANQSKVGAEFDFNAAVGGGTVDITGFNAARDKMVFQGFDTNPVVSQSVVGGSLHLNLQNHTTVILEHLTHM